MAKEVCHSVVLCSGALDFFFFPSILSLFEVFIQDLGPGAGGVTVTLHLSAPHCPQEVRHPQHKLQKLFASDLSQRLLSALKNELKIDQIFK